MTASRRLPLFFAVLIGAVVWSADRASAGTGYNRVNLVSDLPGVAAHTDPNLKNPWGMAFTAASPFWVSDNLTGVATIYDGAGVAQALVVTIPPPGGGAPPSAPTGMVFNAAAGDFAGAHFIFATEDGTVAGWSIGTSAVLQVDNAASGAVYKGLALGNNGSGNFLYATNFNAGRVDVFDHNFTPVILPGAFTDPTLPSGFAPFGIQNIGGVLFVTYAKQDAGKRDPVPGPGNGFVDEFDPNGTFLRRFVSQGVLNSPWGLALAPGTFGDLSGDLLVGNFGDGTIHGFNPATGALVGTLNDGGSHPIVVEGLWGLLFGNGRTDAAQNELFFTAGIPGSGSVEDHGLFGKFTTIIPIPVASSDFDGDGLADKAVFRPGMGTFGAWYVKKSNGSGDLAVQWGASGDVPVAGNYAGDARADFAVFRPSDGTWYVRSAEGVSQPPVQWGASSDVPVPGQYGGDTRIDFAVWRPSNGTWYVRTAEAMLLPSVQWGTAGDIPVPGDYDGDAVTDMAVFRPSNGTWYVRFSGGGTAAIVWGASGDIPVAADFTGDGRADYGIFRPSTGTWYVKSSATLTELPSVAWGASGDVPLPAQMAGDGRADNVVWRPSNGNWYVRSAEGLFLPSVPWGASGDIPIAH